MWRDPLFCWWCYVWRWLCFCCIITVGWTNPFLGDWQKIQKTSTQHKIYCMTWDTVYFQNNQYLQILITKNLLFIYSQKPHTKLHRNVRTLTWWWWSHQDLKALLRSVELVCDVNEEDKIKAKEKHLVKTHGSNKKNKFPYFPLNPGCLRLVGGFNPFEKYESNKKQIPGNSASDLFGMVSSRDPFEGCWWLPTFGDKKVTAWITWFPYFPLNPGCLRLVGGWTNPFEKKIVKHGNLPQGSGLKNKTYLSCHHLEERDPYVVVHYNFPPGERQKSKAWWIFVVCQG